MQAKAALGVICFLYDQIMSSECRSMGVLKTLHDSAARQAPCSFCFGVSSVQWFTNVWTLCSPTVWYSCLFFLGDWHFLLHFYRYILLVHTQKMLWPTGSGNTSLENACFPRQTPNSYSRIPKCDQGLNGHLKSFTWKVALLRAWEKFHK